MYVASSNHNRFMAPIASWRTCGSFVRGNLPRCHISIKHKTHRLHAVPKHDEGHMDDDTVLFNLKNMAVLRNRIARLRMSPSVRLQEQADRALSSKPVLPENVLMWQEFVDDHKLICNWHDQAWKQLKAVSEDIS